MRVYPGSGVDHSDLSSYGFADKMTSMSPCTKPACAEEGRRRRRSNYGSNSCFAADLFRIGFVPGLIIREATRGGLTYQYQVNRHPQIRGQQRNGRAGRAMRETTTCQIGGAYAEKLARICKIALYYWKEDDIWSAIGTLRNAYISFLLSLRAFVFNRKWHEKGTSKIVKLCNFRCLLYVVSNLWIGLQPNARQISCSFQISKHKLRTGAGSRALASHNEVCFADFKRSRALPSGPGMAIALLPLVLARTV